MASGVRPRRSASDPRISTSAAAPSEIEEELAAVTVPPSRKAGFSVGILSGRAFSGCSSVSITVSPPRVFSVTGAISPANLPPWIAALARSSEASAKPSLRLAGELVMLGTILGKGAHQAALVIGVLKPVQEHMVERPAMAEAIAAACLVEQIGRVRHALHAAGDHDAVGADGDQIMRQHGRLHARAANLVDRGWRRSIAAARRRCWPGAPGPGPGPPAARSP